MTLQAGQVEQWLLVNTSPIDHTFHIHQTNFAVISVNSIPVNYANPFASGNPFQYRYTSLRDTVEIPPGGSVVIRFRVSPELGKYVFHCHILEHEDGGMMMAVLAIPNQTERRIALGSLPGQRRAVLVNDGNARPIRRQIKLPPRKVRGGVVTATGELNGDLTQDIVVGTPASPGSPAALSVYDGKSLKRIARFAPFPESPRAGLSLAVGNVEGDGRGDIIVGRVGRGPSLVRIFGGNGALVRTIKGTLPGVLPGGVSVASADFNGDNYDDVAIGAGRGTGPLVVGLDGFSLAQGSRRPARVFALRAAGGPTSGVNLAAGYYDPRTRPGQAANLITTPQAGRRVGQVQVWTPVPAAHQHESTAPPGQPGTTPRSSRALAARLTASRSSETAFILYCIHALGASRGTQYASLASRWRPPLASASAAFPQPRLMATLYPLGKHVRVGLRLAVTFLGEQGLNALAAWTNPHKPAYISINDQGVVSSIRTPTR